MQVIEQKKRPLDSRSESEDDDGFTIVSRKKKEGRREHNVSPPAQVSNNNSPVYDRANPTRFKIRAKSSAEAYKALTTLDQRQKGLKMTAKPNLAGEWVITPHDQNTLQYLRTANCISLQELNPADKIKKAVLKGFSRMLPLEAITEHPKIRNATRMKTRDGQETASILVEIQGPVPSSIRIGFLGTFQIKDYIPEPMRCFKCQRFGHHKAQCTSEIRCAICSGRHDTDACIQKHKDGQQTTAKCPNCGKGHHAWYTRCTERIKRIQQRKTVGTTSAKPAPTSRTPVTKTATAEKTYAAATTNGQNAKKAPAKEPTKVATPATHNIPTPPTTEHQVPVASAPNAQPSRPKRKTKKRSQKKKKVPPKEAPKPQNKETPRSKNKGGEGSITLDLNDVGMVLRNFFNYASKALGQCVPAQQIDSYVDDTIEKLLRRKQEQQTPQPNTSYDLPPPLQAHSSAHRATPSTSSSSSK